MSENFSIPSETKENLIEQILKKKDDKSISSKMQEFSIPSEIREIYVEQIQKEKDDRNRDIEEFINQCKTGYDTDIINDYAGIVPNDGEKNQFNKQVRTFRLKSLEGFKSIKNWMGSQVAEKVRFDINEPATAVMESIENELSNAYVEKNKIVEERKCFIDKILDMSNYDKYLQHKDSYANEEKKFKKQALRSWIAGAFLTLFFTAIDFSMVNTMFINANLPYVRAALMAIITALALDVPLYLLGVLSEKKADLRSYYELMGINSTKYSKQKLRAFNIPQFLLTVVPFSFILIYILSCIMSFAGGGDFNRTFHALMDRDFSVLTDIEYHASDLLQSFVPLVTSVCSYVVGLLLQPSKTELYNKILRMINDKLRERTTEFEIEIAKADEKIRRQKEKLETKKQKYWGVFQGSKPYPVTESEYTIKISQAFKKAFVDNYEQLYEACCIMLLSKAKSYIADISERLARYSNDPIKTRNMQISDDEKAILDEIWIENVSVAEQKSITRSHLEMIHENIKRAKEQLQ